MALMGRITTGLDNLKDYSMPTTSFIRAGAGYIEISGNDAQLVKGLQSATRRLQAFGAGLKSIGASIEQAGLKITTLGVGMVGGLLEAARSFMATGVEYMLGAYQCSAPWARDG